MLNETQAAPVPPIDVDVSALLPSLGNYPIETVYYQRVLLHAPALDAGKDARKLEVEPVDPLTGRRPFAYTTAAFGARLTIRQDWQAMGLTMGQLLHAVSLAPGECTRIAVIDWTRRTSGSQREDTSQLEELSTVGEQARAISEVSHAVAHEMQTGSSQTTTQGSSAQVGVSGAVGSLLGFSGGGSTNDAVATTVATTGGSKDVAADVLQNIQARTQQHATSSRGRRAAVVTETSQSEHEAASTRILANYNHMHALTMQYYEVLQVYSVTVAVAKAEPLLFVPLKPVNFDCSVIRTYRSALVAAATRLEGLASPGAAGMADAIDVCGSASKVLAPADALKGASGGAVPQAWPFLVQQGNTDASLPLRPELEGAKLTGFTIESPADSLLCGWAISNATVIASSNSPMGDLYANLQRGLVNCDLNYNSPATVFTVRPLDSSFSFSLIYRPANANRKPATIRFRVKLADGRDIVLQQVFAPPATSNRRGDVDTFAVCAIQDLGDEQVKRVCAHLNRNALFYSVAIWNAEGCSLPSALSGYTFGNKSLLSCIDPTPVASQDNLMAFRIVDAELAAQVHIEDYVVEAVGKIHDKTIAMPTGGVFGEAVLGQSNAAEKIDLTRFWNWQDSPIPILPPGIDPVSMSSRARDVSLSTGGLEQSAAQFMPLQGLPDPTGLRETSQALMANIFQDMSHARENAETARGALAAASSGAESASSNSLAAYKAALEHQRELMRTAVDAAKTLLPLVAPEAAVGGVAGKLAASGLSGGGGASLSKIGGVLNAAAHVDGRNDASPSLRAAVGQLVGGSAATANDDDGWDPELLVPLEDADPPSDDDAPSDGPSLSA